MPKNFCAGMHDAFVRLEAFLRQPSPAEQDSAQMVAPAQANDHAAGEPPTAQEPADDLADALSEARRFRAALADALDMAVEDLLGDIARNVLARELMLAPADVTAIVEAALERYAGDVPVRVRAHPEDVEVLARLGLPVQADPSLRRGDAGIDLRSGSIDASLLARLESVLSR
jgi:flagellar biosynthesis/type III secretory pathway protein FliH